MGKAERTRERLMAVALDLFAARGYDATTAAQIAAAAGVSEMTFFRHFPAKEDVLIADPYDPAMAEAVAAQDPGLDPLTRVVRGMRQVWQRIPDAGVDIVRARVGVVARTPSLRAAIWRASAATEDAIVEALSRSGTDVLMARAAAAATLAATTVALLEWAGAEGAPAPRMDQVFDLLEHRHG